MRSSKREKNWKLAAEFYESPESLAVLSAGIRKTEKVKKTKKSFQLTAEEKQLESEIEKGEWRSLPQKKGKEMKKTLESYAKAQKKDARVDTMKKEYDFSGGTRGKFSKK